MYDNNRIINLRLSDITPNPLNEVRSMEYKDIENLKDSIKIVGLLHPLVVYERGTGHYYLLSGHRRLAALKSLYDNDYTVPCVVIDKPLSEVEEAEYMARSNVSRKNPDEIREEVVIASKLWDEMPKERRKAISKQFEEKFRAENEDNPTYIADPQKFKTNRFRPRLMYIKSITGLDVSNKTVADILVAKLNESGEGEPNDKKKRQSHGVSYKKLFNTMTRLSEQLDEYAYRADTGKPEYIKELQDDLNKVIERMKELSSETL